MSAFLPLLLAAVEVMAPAVSPVQSPLSVPADPAQLSLVIVDTVSETDPHPLCPQANCTSLFLGAYRNAAVKAGLPLAREFTARVEMGSPFITPYRMVLVVERREGAEPLVRAIRGFNNRTHEACFENGEMDGIDWQPQGEGISYKGKVLCVVE